MSDYNGWANRETWNVALWLGGVEADYRHVVEFMAAYEGSAPYRDYIRHAHLRTAQTPDGVSYTDPALDIAALDEVLLEMRADEAR